MNEGNNSLRPGKFLIHGSSSLHGVLSKCMLCTISPAYPMHDAFWQTGIFSKECDAQRDESLSFSSWPRIPDEKPAFKVNGRSLANEIRDATASIRP